MELKKTLLAVAVAALSGAASATPVSVAGVTWDPDSFFDLTANTELFELPVTTAGSTLSGYGAVTSINNKTDFCAGCELTFTFTGYTLLNNVTAITPSFAFSGGVFNFYVSAVNASAGDVSTYNDGVLWLTLAGADPLGLGGTLTGNATIPTSGGISGQGTGYLDVVLNGLAAAEGHFDTNSQFGADLAYTSSFQPFPNGGALPDGLTHFGTANISGNSIPEPGVLALMGLGLAGLGFARRNKKQA